MDLETRLAERTYKLKKTFKQLRQRKREIAELHAQQSATAEILRAISSSPIELQLVFDAIARNATILCESLYANVFRYDGEMIHFVATHGWPPRLLPALYRAFPMTPNVSRVAGRVILGKEIVHIEDVLSDRDYDHDLARDLGGYRRILGVPMLRGVTPLGAITVGWAKPGLIAKHHEGLLRTFADQAVIAIENVRLIKEIQERSRQLELANTFKSRFLAAASHDIRQPLHALNLFVDQLHADLDPAERARVITQIDAALNAMNELFNALLDVSKLDAGVLKANTSEFPVDHVLKRVKITFAGAAREKGLRLRVAASRAWIRSDVILLERILDNLVSNAVRYTVRGSVEITCRRRGKQLRLEVSDSGPGIPEKEGQNVFHEFYQLDASRGDHRSGLGLGLAIVKRLGRLLGHPIELTSVVGKGSIFSISVPLAAGQCRRAITMRPAVLPGDPSGKLIVVIDDDALVLQAMKDILWRWGCRVIPAKSDAAALEHLDSIKQHPDLIISDYRLAEGRDGIRAIENIRRALGQSIPAFLVTGDTAPEPLREATASNLHLLQKPVPSMRLRAIIGRLLKAQNPSSQSA